jgi:diaminopimelate decarboxylase
VVQAEERQEIGLADLTARFGSPLYVYDLAELRRSAARLRAALPAGSRLLYSVKANPHPAVITELLAAGAGVEISSAGELDMILAAGAEPSGALYTGPGKSAAEIDGAIRAGVRRFSVESAVDLDRLRSVATRLHTPVEFLLRVNGGRSSGGSGLRMMGTATQFGMDLEAVLAEPGLFAVHPYARAVGVHLFSMSNAADETALLQEFRRSLETARVVGERAGVELPIIDLGGGFAAPYAAPGEHPRYAGLRQALTELLDRHCPAWSAAPENLWFESGRALVSGCGVLHTTVADVKRTQGAVFAVLDAGVNTLGGLNGLGRLLNPSVTPLVEPDASARPLVEATLVGPLCTPLDVHHRRITMPEPRPGDVLTVPNVGAYGLSASLLAFLGRPAAAEIVVDGASVVSARRLTVGAIELEIDDQRVG